MNRRVLSFAGLVRLANPTKKRDRVSSLEVQMRWSSPYSKDGFSCPSEPPRPQLIMQPQPRSNRCPPKVATVGRIIGLRPHKTQPGYSKKAEEFDANISVRGSVHSPRRICFCDGPMNLLSPEA